MKLFTLCDDLYKRGRMNDPFPVRLNDKTGPDRTARMTAVEEKWRISVTDVLRGLVDAYLEYIEKHGHPPTFPVAIAPKEETAATPGKKRTKQDSP